MKRHSNNPARSASQYGAAQAVRAGSSRIMPRQAAEQLIAETPARKRRQFAAELAARRRPNQEPSAAELSEQFHGRPVREVTAVMETVRTRTELAQLGRLLELIVLTDEDRYLSLPFERRGVELCASPSGGQLYLVGGNQRLDLESVDVEATGKDDLEIGELVAVVYHSRKGFHAFEPTEYVHEFGEESGFRPRLCYDALNCALRITGGNYQVKPEGIVD